MCHGAVSDGSGADGKVGICDFDLLMMKFQGYIPSFLRHVYTCQVDMISLPPFLLPSKQIVQLLSTLPFRRKCSKWPRTLGNAVP